MSHHFRTLLLSGATAFALTTLVPQAVAAQAKPNDETLEDRVAYRLEVNEALRRYDLKVDVKDGIAMLTGDVATAAQKAEAARVAKIDNIARVENDIVVKADADKTVAERTKAGLNKAGQKIDDAWITTKVKWFVMRDDVLDGSDINVDTRANVVTLKGTVATSAGRTRATTLARQTEGVKDVVTELTIAPRK